MAVISTTFTPDAEVFPFTGLGDLVTDRSDHPRGEVSYNILNGVVTAGAAGDSQALFVRCVLPANFSYALVDIYASLVGTALGDSDDWDDGGLFTMVEIVDGVQTMACFMGGHATGIAGVIKSWIWPKTVGRVVKGGSTAGAAIVPTLNLQNQVLDGAANSLQFYARFLQYDIVQQHHIGVNTAILTR